MSNLARDLTKHSESRKKTRESPNGGAGDRGEIQSSQVVVSQKKEGRVAMADMRGNSNTTTQEQKQNAGSQEKRSSEKLAGGKIEIQYLEKTVGALWRKVRRRGANQMRALFAPKVLARQE